MPSPQHCLAMADEADRLAGIVSYERDKVRLRNQAAAWRQMANVMLEPVVMTVDAAPLAIPEARRTSGMAGWLKRRWA